jgi:glycosyltransferase involved in cell wall biosynthesis
MTFLFITREGHDHPGARNRCYGFAQKLKKRGLEAEVFSFVDNLGAKAGKDDKNFGVMQKTKYIYKSFKFLYRQKTETIFIINRFNYHALSPWVVSKLKKIPYIFDMDDWEAREKLEYYLGIIPKSKAEYFTRLFAKNSVFCIAASLHLRDYLLNFNRKVYYLPTGVDTEKFKPSSDSDNKENLVFSWHGSINRPEIINYIKFIIECFLVLYKKYSFIKLFIAGDGIYKKQLIFLIKNYYCKDIKYWGKIPYQNIPQYLDKIDVGLIPLLDKTYFNLSKSPVKLFEYMAKAKPTISSKLGEAEVLIEDGENGFLAETKEEFIEKMRILIRNRSLCKKIGDKARQTVEGKYSLDILSEKLYNFLIQCEF